MSLPNISGYTAEGINVMGKTPQKNMLLIVKLHIDRLYHSAKINNSS